MTEKLTGPQFKKIIDNAIEQIDVYRHPNIYEAQATISNVLKAAGIGNIDNDSLLSIYYTDYIHISTEWYSRGCQQTGDYDLPTNLFDSDDVIRDATIYGIKLQIQKEQNAFNVAKANFVKAEEKLKALQKSLEELIRTE